MNCGRQNSSDCGRATYSEAPTHCDRVFEQCVPNRSASPCHLTEARRYKLNLGRGPPFGAKVGGVKDDDYPVRRQLKPLQARAATERDAVSLLYRF